MSDQFVGLSCATYSWPSLSLENSFKLISMLGFDAVDIGVFSGSSHITPEYVALNPITAASFIQRLLDRHGLKCADVFLIPATNFEGCNPMHDDLETFRNLNNFVSSTAEFCRHLRVKGLTVLPGTPSATESHEQAIGRVAPGLLRWLTLTKDQGIELSVEPHSGSCIDTPARSCALVESVPELKLTLDPAHFLFGGATNEDLIKVIPHSRHVQLRGARNQVMQARMVESELNLRDLLEQLRKAGYNGYLASEYVWHETWNCDRVDNISETSALRDEVRNIIAHMRAKAAAS